MRYKYQYGLPMVIIIEVCKKADRREKDMATLKDVAAETGLTVSTVSRVLNNRGYISDKTRKKYMMRWRSSIIPLTRVARSLSKKTNNTIGVIVPHIRHPYFAELISNLERACYNRNYKMFIFNSREKQEKRKMNILKCAEATGWQESLCVVER